MEIRARVNGYLDKINFKDGEEVKEGFVLFDIDPRQYDAELARTEASLAQAEAHAKRLTADYTRAVSLKGREVLSRQEYDQVTGDYTEANSAVGIAKAARDLAKLNQSYTKVTSPISGRLSRRMVDRGNLIKADETMLTTIVSLDPIYVYFDVDERTLLKIRRLVAEGKIKFAAPEANKNRRSTPGLADETTGEPPEQAYPHEGFINFSENRLEQSTGTLRVRAEIPNPEPRVLSPGFFMRVKLPIGTPHYGLLVPEQEEALGHGPGEQVPVRDQAQEGAGEGRQGQGDRSLPHGERRRVPQGPGRAPCHGRPPADPGELEGGRRSCVHGPPAKRLAPGRRSRPQARPLTPRRLGRGREQADRPQGARRGDA